MKPKNSDEIDRFICERYAAGLSLRDIAEWLKSKGLGTISHVSVRTRLHALKAAGKVGAPTEPVPNDRTPDEPGPTTTDVDLLNRIIADLEGDLRSARERGSLNNIGTLTRLLGDQIERRARMRPPPAIDPRDDAECRAAGERCLVKLRSLIAAAKEQRT